MKRVCFAAIAVVLVACIAMAQDQEPTGGRPARGRIMTATRQAALASDLETRLMRTLETQDAAAASAMLCDDFDATIAGQADPVPRADWLRQSLAARTATYRIRNLSARFLGDGIVASFVLVENSGASSPANSAEAARKTAFFVVDAWQQTAGSWKLMARYAAPTNAPADETHPTGKQ